MHELFITASMPAAHVPDALKIIQGLCGMNPIYRLERRLIFEGPKANPLVGLNAANLQSRKPANIPLWRELNEQLVRQSYYISVSYQVKKEDFGNHSTTQGGDGVMERPIASVEEERGTLHFLDYADPPGTRPCNSRLVIHIKDEARLPELMKSIRYNYSSEQVREMYNSYRDSVTFCLSRELRRPKVEGISSEAMGEVPHSLPAFEDYTPFDPENKWILTVSVEVSDEKQGAFVQRGIDQLGQVEKDCEGIFKFSVRNRRFLDTRQPAYLQSTRA